MSRSPAIRGEAVWDAVNRKHKYVASTPVDLAVKKLPNTGPEAS
jgi:hypothetical protein